MFFHFFAYRLVPHSSQSANPSEKTFVGYTSEGLEVAGQHPSCFSLLSPLKVRFCEFSYLHFLSDWLKRFYFLKSIADLK